jgi:hypothetical protein
LEQEFIALQNYGINEFGLFEKAKEMEKQQINKACYDGYYQEEMMNTKEYYDKTFNNKIIQNKFGKLK